MAQREADHGEWWIAEKPIPASSLNSQVVNHIHISTPNGITEKKKPTDKRSESQVEAVCLCHSFAIKNRARIEIVGFEQSEKCFVND